MICNDENLVNGSSSDDAGLIKYKIGSFNESKTYEDDTDFVKELSMIEKKRKFNERILKYNKTSMQLQKVKSSAFDNSFISLEMSFDTGTKKNSQSTSNDFCSTPRDSFPRDKLKRIFINELHSNQSLSSIDENETQNVEGAHIQIQTTFSEEERSILEPTTITQEKVNEQKHFDPDTTLIEIPHTNEIVNQPNTDSKSNEIEEKLVIKVSPQKAKSQFDLLKNMLNKRSINGTAKFSNNLNGNVKDTIYIIKQSQDMNNNTHHDTLKEFCDKYGKDEME